MRDEAYGISVIGFAAGLYGIAAWIGLAHATATLPKENVAFTQTETSIRTLAEEKVAVIASLR